MTETPSPLEPISSDLDALFPTLTPAQLQRVAARGRARPVESSEVLVEAGEQSARIFVVQAGQVELVQPFADLQAMTNALERASHEVSNDIRTRIAAHFAAG